ncbi:hypothetical protein Golax_025980 [Gossypium laxum]|uniref:Reverse transcriptase zinc-binding domain-containing protein n=1 Tax=Gossypium laxum TaxID=34288 RepID=A0A7J9B5Z6_9ROSI|nr:hypothetical protein [Gossypium laxum]
MAYPLVSLAAIVLSSVETYLRRWLQKKDRIIKSTYRIIKKSSWNPREEAWNVPWKVHGPQRVQIFLWLVLKQWLLTQEKRLRRGFGSDARCLICGHDVEDVIHVVRDCVVAKEDWLLSKLQNHHNYAMMNVDLSCFFGIVDWHISKNRNLCIFSGTLWSVEEIVKNAYSWATHYLAGHNGSSMRQTSRVDIIEAGRWIQLRSDGIGILDDVMLVQGRHYDQVLVRTDNMEVIRAIKESLSKSSNSALIRHISQPLQNCKVGPLNIFLENKILKLIALPNWHLIEGRAYNYSKILLLNTFSFV